MMAADPGLQPERTHLAWGRTLVASLVLDFFVLRALAIAVAGGGGNAGAGSNPGAVPVGLIVATVIAGVATSALAICVRQRALTLRTGAPPQVALFRIVTVATVAVAASAILAISLGRG